MKSIIHRIGLAGLIVFSAGFFGHARAQAGGEPVQVSKEPRHHNVYENAWVRVLDVHIPAGDTSLMHKHSTPSVFMILSNTRTGSEVIVEPEKPTFNDGHIWFEGFYTTPRIHRVWNSDTVEFHVIDMELVNPHPGQIQQPMRQPELALLFDEKPVRAYRLTAAANRSITLPKRGAPMLVVGLFHAEQPVIIAGKAFSKKGDFAFFEAGTRLTIVNKGDSSQPLALYELK